MLETQFLDGQRAKLPALPLEMGHHQIRIRQQPPQKGEHSIEILKEAGFTTEEIKAWVDAGIVIDGQKM